MALISPSRATGTLFGPSGDVVSFGFITDTHHDPIKASVADQGGKYYQSSAQKVADIATAFNARTDLSFAFQNGDFIDGSNDAPTAITDLTTITGVFNAINVPKYHNVGNHEVSHLTKPAIHAVTGQPSKWYSFDTGGVKFIVLDGNFTADDDTADLSESFGTSPSPYVSYIPPTQRQWLADTIAGSTYPCVVICHYPIYYVGAFSWGLTNAAAVRAILEASGKVIGCVSGHLHDNYIRRLNNISYCTVHATVAGAYPLLPYAIVKVYPIKREIEVLASGYDMSFIPTT